MPGHGFRQSLSQRQALKHTLSLKNRLALKYLPMNSLELKQCAEEKMAYNPLVDDFIISSRENDFENMQKMIEAAKERDKWEEYQAGFSEYEFHPEASDNHSRALQNAPEIRIESLEAYVINQIENLDISSKLKETAVFVSYLMNDRGLITESDEEIAVILKNEFNFDITEKQACEARRIIMGCLPAGVGCRTEQEALLCQLSRAKIVKESAAYLIIRDHYDDFLNQRNEVIMKKTGLKEKDFNKTCNVIKSAVNPNIAGAFAAQPDYVEPDAIITEDGEVEISGMQIKINEQSRKLYESRKAELEKKNDITKQEKKELEEINEYLEDALTFKECMEMRMATIKKAAVMIVKHQKDYIMNESDNMNPLTQKELAAEIGHSPSTVCRAIREKYIKLPYGRGVVLLSAFFVKEAKMAAGSTGNKMTREDVKRRVKEIVDAEDKNHPLIDAQIAELLNKEGIVYKRRMISRFRGEMGISGEKERKGK